MVSQGQSEALVPFFISPFPALVSLPRSSPPIPILITSFKKQLFSSKVAFQLAQIYNFYQGYGMLLLR